MFRRLEDLRDGAGLDDAAVLHHGDVVGDGPHDAEIVGDEQHRHVMARLQFLQELQDLRLHGHVERRRRLVGDEEIGAVGESHRDHHALALTAGQLMREGAVFFGRVADPDFGQEFERPRLDGARAAHAVQFEDLADLPGDRMQRIERRHGLLEDHGDRIAAQIAHVALARAEQFLAPKADGTADARLVRQQTDDRERGDRLAGPRFADERQRAAGRQRKRHAVDRLRHPAVRLPEGDGEVADVEKWLVAHAIASCAYWMPAASGMTRTRDAGILSMSLSAAIMNWHCASIAVAM